MGEEQWDEEEPEEEEEGLLEDGGVSQIEYPPLPDRR